MLRYPIHPKLQVYNTGSICVVLRLSTGDRMKRLSAGVGRNQTIFSGVPEGRLTISFSRVETTPERVTFNQCEEA